MVATCCSTPLLHTIGRLIAKSLRKISSEVTRNRTNHWFLDSNSYVDIDINILQNKGQSSAHYYSSNKVIFHIILPFSKSIHPYFNLFPVTLFLAPPTHSSCTRIPTAGRPPPASASTRGSTPSGSPDSRGTTTSLARRESGGLRRQQRWTTQATDSGLPQGICQHVIFFSRLDNEC